MFTIYGNHTINGERKQVSSIEMADVGLMTIGLGVMSFSIRNGCNTQNNQPTAI
jgi:hypothetical protein